MVVPTVNLNPWLLGLLYSQNREKRSYFSVPSMSLKRMARLTSLFYSPEAHADEIKTTYSDMLEDGRRLREHQAKVDIRVSPPNDLYLGCTEHADRMKHAYPLRVIYSVLLTMTAALNSLLQAFDPGKNDLLEERIMVVESAVAVARQGLQYRPLGASYVPCCLVAMVSRKDIPFLIDFEGTS